MTARRYTLRSRALTSSFKIDYARALNAQQLAVVEAAGGPMLVIAGAGSGKTRTLVYRVARLLESGLRPDEILLLTFTNRAAGQMLARVEELVGGELGSESRRVEGGTFHSVAHRTLREHASLLGYGDRFGIMDKGDAADLMKAVIAEKGLASRARRFPTADVLLRLLSMAVNTQAPIAEIIAERCPRFVSLTDDILGAMSRYVERKVAMDLMDFDDLLMNWKILLEEHPAVRAAQSSRFRHVLVDEYQDTNQLQADIVDAVAGAHGNLMVVGDDAQSIYSFRGASFENILGFPERHPGCAVFHLTSNYRSTPEILGLANKSIANNLRQFPKDLESVRTSGSMPALVPCGDVYQQADLVCQRLLELRDEGIGLSDVAILYRAHYHSMELQVELSRRGIPFVVRSGLRFFEHAHIKDVLAHLRFVHNPQDELAFKRIVTLRPGMGSVAADKLWSWIEARTVHRGSPLHCLLRKEALLEISPRSRPGLEALQELLREISGRRGASEQVAGPPADMIRRVLEGGYSEYARAQWLNGDSRIEDVEQLADFAEQYEDLGDFLGDIGLLTELEGEDVIEGGEPDEAVTLSSIHKAKGLEWRAVFVIWLADGRFPVAAAYRDSGGFEEERRLFYVAVTRAKDELYLCYPIMYSGRDHERVIMKPSPFIDELTEGELPFEKWCLEIEETGARDEMLVEGSGLSLPARVPRYLGDGSSD